MSAVEVVTIGSALLTGTVSNSNATFLCNQLTQLGYVVTGCHTVPNTKNELRYALDRVLRERPLVIATGALGPGAGDITKDVVAQIFDSGFRFDDGIAAGLRERYGDDLSILQNEATVPSKATIFPNDIGTAPALVFEALTVTLILLPGSPTEMEAIFTKSVRPYLQKRIETEHRVLRRTVLLPGVRAREVEGVLEELREVNPALRYDIQSMPAILRVTLRTDVADTQSADELLAEASTVLAYRYADNIVDTGDSSIEQAIHRLFISRELTLSVAESCSGGAFAARLTSRPGASSYFRGGVVSYANSVKCNVLSVGDSTLESFGAVSAEVAEQMASGVLNLTGSDYSVAVTGIAGPDGGTPDKPVGTVWLAIAARSGWVTSWMIRGHGSRDRVIEASINAALSRLWLLVSQDSEGLT